MRKNTSVRKLWSSYWIKVSQLSFIFVFCLYLNLYYIYIWNRLPCSAVSHVIHSVDNFHKFAIPAIRVMQPLYGEFFVIFYFIFCLFETIAFYLQVIFTFFS